MACFWTVADFWTAASSWIERITQILAWSATVAIAVATVGDALGAWDAFESLSGVGEVRNEAALNSVGDCERSMPIEVGQSCRFEIDPRSGVIAEFRVVRLGAYPPGATTLRSRAIKVDWDNLQRTFQAVNLQDGSGTWRIEAAGAWIDIHEGNAHCTAKDLLGPGQFCTERATGAQFRVYGSDQLNPNDVRQSFDRGYAVLYWFRKDMDIPSVGNGLLGPDVVELRCPEQASPFVAKRKRTDAVQEWMVERADGEADAVCGNRRQRKTSP